MNLPDKLIVYLSKKLNSLEIERDEVNRRIRLHPMDSLDLYDAMREYVRLECWSEFMDDLSHIVLYDRKKE